MFYVIKTMRFMNLHEDCMNSTTIWPLRNSNLIWDVIMSSYSGKSSRRTFMGARDGRDEPQIISRVNHIKWNLWRNWADIFHFYRIQRIFTVSKMTIWADGLPSWNILPRWSIPPSYRIRIFLRFSSEIIRILYLEIAQNSAKNARSRWSCGVK